jgi:hypothetical protein
MKVEFFAHGSVESPLLLLYGSDPNDAATLSHTFGDLAHASVTRVAVHELPGFVSVDGCQLFGSIARSDVGVKMVASPAVFDCALRPETWANVVGLLEPFSHPSKARGTQFQFLCDTGDVRLLISTKRAW